MGLLLHGATPSPVALAFAYAIGFAAAALAWKTGPGGIAGAVLTLLALDWAAGIVANATRSTRAFHAAKPLWWAVAFVALHAAEIPLLWWLAQDATLATWMLLLLALKLAVFIIGQAELRTRHP
ncbi:MAG: hypothetical protein ACK6DM_09945 [Alphaproteobacteria bacterium]